MQKYYAFLVFIGGCSYGVTSTVVKTAYQYGYTIREVAVGQIVLGALMLWLFALAVPGKKLSIQTIGKLLLAGVPIGLTTIFYYGALSYVRASLGLILLFQFVWIGVLMERLIQKKPISSQKVIAIFFLLVGSTLASGLTVDMLESQWIGYVLGLGSALTYAAVLLVSGIVATEVPSVLKSAWMSTGALVVIVFFFSPTFLTDFSVVQDFFPYMALLSCFGLVLPPVLFAIGVPKIGAGLSSILTSSELPMGIALSYMFLGERFTWMQWLGVFSILAGIVVGNLRFDRVPK